MSGGAARSLLLSLAILMSHSSCARAERESEIATLVDEYFSSWSRGDRVSYSRCFHPAAQVQYISEKGEVVSYPLASFLAEQASIQATLHAREVPLEMRIVIEQDTAHAVARWRLTARGRETTGVDHFVLVRTNGAWRILVLVWRQD